MKRLISAFYSDIKEMNKEELLNSIKSSEGRVIMSENIIAYESLLRTVSNPELAKAFGADMLLLNLFDVFNPKIYGINAKNPIKKLKEYTACPIGINLEPVDLEKELNVDRENISKGRTASKETFIKANELGVDFICLTGNPGVGVSNDSILNAIKLAKENFKGIIIAGKMHGAGINEKIFNQSLIKDFIDAGADIILLPALNTVPQVSENDLVEAVNYIHSQNKLALAAIGTSQESSSEDVIKTIGLSSKRIGFDIHHIGDGSFTGIAIPENIMTLSNTIRGKRHTYFKMAASIRR